MSLADVPLVELASALAAVDNEFVCSGTWRGDEPLALVLPSGERLVLGKGAARDRFVRSLTDLSEPAPFGDATGTRTDARVRNARRALGRDKIIVEGFNPATSGVLELVERALSPYGSIAASLTDVILYPEGGHFVVHKDTPRSEQMVGTLVVGLPIAHEGGALELRRAGLEVALDWGSGPPSSTELSWAAFYGDVDHRVLPVTRGTRVTLTYELSVVATQRPKDEPQTSATLRLALERMVHDGWFAKGEPLFIPCAHMVIAGRREKAGLPLPVSGLRGRDRQVAAIVEELELQANVRPCLAIVEPDGKRLPRSPLREAERMTLERPLSPAARAALGGWVVLEGEATGEDGESLEAYSLERFNPEAIDEARYVTRDAAHADFLTQSEAYSSTGYFGNEFGEALFYTFAAIEVSAPPPSTEFLASPRREERVVHPRFGRGIITTERSSEGRTILEVQFEDGSNRKLEASFVKRIP